MYFHNVAGTGRYTTSTNNMYNNDFTYLGTITAMVPNVAFAHALFAFTVVVTFVFTGGVLAETSGPARVTRTLPRHTDTVFGTVLWAKAENQ
jgi:hypothetical protein